MMPSISILTPTFNCEKTINKTIESVQKLLILFPNKIEHIIGDAGSTDGTLDSLNVYKDQFENVKIRNLSGYDIPQTLNVLIDEASQEVIIILNGDDYLDVPKLCSAFSKCDLVGLNAIICANVIITDKNGHQVGVRNTSLPDIRNYMSINHPAMLVPKVIYKEHGLFDVDCPNSFDYIWTWNAWINGVQFIQIDELVAVVMLGGISETRASIAAREIFVYKFKRGEYMQAFSNYISFGLKKFLRDLIPSSYYLKLRARYRRISSSIDKY
jgi:glycosyltransferase involved in cell wall biosynthesis